MLIMYYRSLADPTNWTEGQSLRGNWEKGDNFGALYTTLASGAWLVDLASVFTPLSIASATRLLGSCIMIIGCLTYSRRVCTAIVLYSILIIFMSRRMTIRTLKKKKKLQVWTFLCSVNVGKLQSRVLT